MTQQSETQERLKQIERWINRHTTQNCDPYADLRRALSEIDFLLSLIDTRAPVDSQGVEVESSHWSNEWPTENGFYWIRGWRHYGDLPINVDGEFFWMMFNLAKNHRTDLDDSEDVQFLGPITPYTVITAATQMRDACVETLKSLPDHPATCGVWVQQGCSCSFRKEAIAAVESLTLDQVKQK